MRPAAQRRRDLAPLGEAASSKLGVMLVGVGGAVASTMLSGVLAAVRGVATPRGAITESADCDGLDLAPLSSLAFGGWDIDQSPLSERVRHHGVVSAQVLDTVAPGLDEVRVEPGVVANLSSTVRRLSRGPDIADTTHSEAVDRLLADIAGFRSRLRLNRVVVVYCSSTDRTPIGGPSHRDPRSFRHGLAKNAPEIGNGMLYAYAAITAGCAFVNFTPNTTVEVPALRELADYHGVPLAGRDGKTGQTLYKTVLAPMLRARDLKLTGWYSTNILGNTDGQVLEDPLHGATKVHTKEGVLEQILGYADFDHRVRIDYYRPRGDAKEAWDCIDFEGWLNTPMSMRINWQGIDSVLAAPLVLDLLRLADLAQRRGERGPLPQLAMFFKDPYGPPEHDFFRQVARFRQYVEDCKAESGAVVTTASE
jgi:myo-inositol-1-phosphate synthase